LQSLSCEHEIPAIPDDFGPHALSGNVAKAIASASATDPTHPATTLRNVALKPTRHAVMPLF
jgi:hypothetical protein